jgi:hypothetical protein
MSGWRAGAGVNRAGLQPRERRCHVCRCTETRACPGRCWWIGADLCSSCGPRAARHLKHRQPKRITARFWFRRYAQFNLDLVTWTLSARIGSRVYQVEQSFDISDIKHRGRDRVADTLRVLRREIKAQQAQLPRELSAPI